MKFYLTALLLILAIRLSSQSIDSLGIDNNPMLNKYEAEYFNIEFIEWRKDFDFTDKKVAFLTGNMANRHLTKVDYFDQVKLILSNKHEMVHSALYLTEEEKLKSGDYDAIVVSWVKILTDKRRRQIINELKAASRYVPCAYSF